MHTNVNIHDFRQAFKSLRPTNFSYDGLKVLFDYLEELEQELGQPIELDVVGFCCEYQESVLEEINEEFSHMIDEPFEDLDQAFMWLAEKTVVCGRTDDSVVFASF